MLDNKMNDQLYRGNIIIIIKFAMCTPSRALYLIQKLQTYKASIYKYVLVGVQQVCVCTQGCQRAATMYATSGSAARRLGSAARARTSLAPGRFQRWMLDVRVASFVHEYALCYCFSPFTQHSILGEQLSAFHIQSYRLVSKVFE